MKFREVVRLQEFERDFKRLLMKYNTLEEDLAKFIDRQLFIYHKLGLDNRGVFPIDDLGSTTAPVFKAKKFACRSLKGRGVKSGIRVIYAYHKGCDRVELVEIYVKSDKEVEDRPRIKRYYSEKR